MNNETVQVTQTPSLFKLGACFVYEILIVIALAFVCTLPYLVLFGDASHGIKRNYLQLLLWVCIGCYFVWCWHQKGQTLAMQAWQLKVVGQDAKLLTVKQSILRYILATFSLVLVGFGFLWIIFDPKRLFLHDRLLKTCVIYVPRNKA
ncbi:MAG: RDD family protein [Methylophilaceae bacterium]